MAGRPDDEWEGLRQDLAEVTTTLFAGVASAWGALAGALEDRPDAEARPEPGPGPGPGLPLGELPAPGPRALPQALPQEKGRWDAPPSPARSARPRAPSRPPALRSRPAAVFRPRGVRSPRLPPPPRPEVDGTSSPGGGEKARTTMARGAGAPRQPAREGVVCSQGGALPLWGGCGCWPTPRPATL